MQVQRHRDALAEQVEALDGLTRRRLTVLVGGAGTGKTSVMGALVASKELAAEGLLLLAPTGKASVRTDQASPIATGSNVSSHAPKLKLPAERFGWWVRAGVASACVGRRSCLRSGSVLNPASIAMNFPNRLRLVLLLASLSAAGAAEPNPYFGLGPARFKPTGFFRLAQTQGRDHLVTPDGRAYLALGVNHVDMLQQAAANGLSVRGDAAWRKFWEETLRPQFAAWHLTTLGYGAPAPLRRQVPWFATLTLAAIEKHRSDPSSGSPNGYRFPDVFDPAWAGDVAGRIKQAAAPLRDDPFVIGYLWTDTPTWDVIKTRALRGTDWVSAIRALPPGAPGRQAYATFLEERHAGRLAEFNAIYGLAVGSFGELREVALTALAVGRHAVQEDDDAFLAHIARRFHEIVGRAQREADPNHLVFGDRYLAGDAPESVLRAAAPWIDAVAVQPGDRYLPLFPASTHFPAADIGALHAVTGKPVLICDHAISFPTAAQPRTIFEQMPDEAAAASATADFLAAAFAQPYMLGYLRCQYIDRPAGFGRGLRQGLLRPDGTPRDALVRVYRDGFAAARKRVEELTP